MKTINRRDHSRIRSLRRRRKVHGVTFDGDKVWFAAGDKLNALDPATAARPCARIDVAAHAGTAFDGKHLYQIAETRSRRSIPKTGRVLATIPAPGGGGDSGLAWAEGSLWVGEYRDRKIHQIDPETGKILRTHRVEPLRHGRDLGRWRALARHVGSDESELRHDRSEDRRGAGELEMPGGASCSGLESDGKDRFYCGGGGSGKLRAVRRPKRT